MGFLNGFEQFSNRRSAAPTVTKNASSLIDCIVNLFDVIYIRSVSVLVEELQCHDLDSTIDANDTNAIVANAPDCTGTVSSVTIVIHRIS